MNSWIDRSWPAAKGLPARNRSAGWELATAAGLAGIIMVVGCTENPVEAIVDQGVLKASAGAEELLVADGFDREMEGGWGTADRGGAWEEDQPEDFSVAAGVGLIVKSDPGSRRAFASTGAGLNVVGQTSFSIDTPPDNPRRFYTVQAYARVQENGDYYRFRVRAYGDGWMDGRVEARIGDSKHWVTDPHPLDVKWEAGGLHHFRWEVTGTSPSTTLRMRVWKEGDAEPADWQLDEEIDLPPLDLPGTTGLRISGPSADQTTFPVTFAFDDIEYRSFAVSIHNEPPLSHAGGPYTGTAGGTIQLDGSGSTDPDGDTPLAYRWDLGDGNTATGATPTHTYAAAGVYTISLVVTDSRGLPSDPSTTTATIEAASSPSGVLIRDSFSRTLSTGWGTPDIGPGWYLGSGDPADFRVQNGRGYVIRSDNSMRNAVPRDGPTSEGYGVNVRGIASFKIDTPPDNPGRRYTIQVYARRDDRTSDGDNYFRYRVRASGRGDMDVRLEKNVNGSSAWLSDNVDISVRWEAGRTYWIRWEAIGTSPNTYVRMRVWIDGATEPASWDVAVTVNEPALDVIGTTGFRISGPNGDEQTTLPIIASVGDLEYVEVD